MKSYAEKFCFMRAYVCFLMTALLCLGMLTGCTKQTEDEDALLTAGDNSNVSVQAADGETLQVTDPLNVAPPIVRGTALTINGKEYSSEMSQVFFVSVYFEFLQENGSYLAMYGLDVSNGIPGLVDQACNFSEDGTWYGYFRDLTVQRMKQATALNDYAALKGISLPEEEVTAIDDMMKAMEAEALGDGFTDVNDYLAHYYGQGVTEDIYRQYVEIMTLANEAYGDYFRQLEFTDEELEAHFTEMGYVEEDYHYPLTAMRHVLIMAEANEEGEYTEEAIQAAHDRVEELYQEWLSGDQSEESFAEMANTYSADGGSNTNGGLYTDIYNGEMIPGINTWLFDEEREVGDTVIVDNNGSYTGSHIVYFMGYGEIYSHVVARDDMMKNALTDWMIGLIDSCEVTEGIAYSGIGLAYQ